MRLPIAVNPDEVVEVEFCPAALDRAKRVWSSVLERAQERKLSAQIDAAQLALDLNAKDRAEYVPGAGPTFSIGMIPGEHRATIAGMVAEVDKLQGAERATAEHRWRRYLVRWAIRGHRGLKRRDGSEQAFMGEAVRVAGEEVTVPTEKQIEVYAASGLLADLAGIALDLQQLGADEKNG